MGAGAKSGRADYHSGQWGDKAVYVYRNGIPIARGRPEVVDPDNSLGSHAFTMLEGIAENESPFAPGRPAHRWMAVRTQGQTTLEDLAKRVRVTPVLLEKLYDLLAPGTTIVVTDARPCTVRPRRTPSCHGVGAGA